MGLTIDQQFSKALQMQEWPSDKPFMYRGYTGSNDLYYSDKPASYLDEFVCSKEDFEESNRNK